jgi:putative FmdB family regulatory protein
MPAYDFRCNQCENEFSLIYKSIKSYGDATPTCPSCQSTDLKRIIHKINVQAPSRDFTRMNSQDMLSVFESGDSKQVGQMFDQIGGTNPALGAEYHETTQKLLKGESMDSVEKSLQAKSDEKPAKAEKKNNKK